LQEFDTEGKYAGEIRNRDPLADAACLGALGRRIREKTLYRYKPYWSRPASHKILGLPATALLLKDPKSSRRFAYLHDDKHLLKKATPVVDPETVPKKKKKQPKTACIIAEDLEPQPTLQANKSKAKKPRTPLKHCNGTQ
jgi:hypothetical protein